MTDMNSTNDEPNFDDGSHLSPEEEADLQEAEDRVTPVAYAGQDFDVEGLVRRLRNGDIKVPQFGNNDDDILTPGFQRGFVWNKSQMDRFIESLLLGYPIPGIFLVRQADKRYLVLDGQQRLKTLEYFYRGIYQSRQFALKNVSRDFDGLTYETLSPELRRTLDNAFIQATIVDTDGTPESLEAVYQIFERLNSGGTQLTPHEIRVALYAGSFIDFVESLNLNESWRSLYGAKNQRIRDQELIVRILALYSNSAAYSRPLKSFLNKFVAENRLGPSELMAEAGELFVAASRLLLDGPGPEALRRASRQVNYSQTDAIYVGLMTALKDATLTAEQCIARVEDLRENSEFQDFITGPTADEEMVKGRLQIAIATFGE